MALLKALFRVLVVAVLLSPFCVQARPMGGKFGVESIYSNGSAEIKVNGTCHMMGLYEGSKITISGRLGKVKGEKFKLRIVAKLFKLECANLMEFDIDKKRFSPCEHNPDLSAVPDYEGNMDIELEQVINRTNSLSRFVFDMNFTTFDAHSTKASPTTATPPTTTKIPPTTTKTPPTEPPTKAPLTAAPTIATAKSDPAKAPSKRDVPEEKTSTALSAPTATPTDSTTGGQTKGVPAMSINSRRGSGVYLLQVYVQRLEDTPEADDVVVNLTIEMKNSHGYLSAIDYPALVFYGIMTSVYTIYAIAWIVMMLCSFNDLVRLQFWVLAVIILGFLEKTFFVAEYSAINLGNDTYGSYIIAEFVSAVKRGLSRMLLIIVAMGFGTVKPRLGDSLFKVVAAGVAYFVLALIDGIMRSRTDTFHTRDTSSMVTLVLLLLLDTFIFYWIFTSIVDTRRTLRLRKNYVKLAMYNHFAYTLIFAIIATVAFIIWVFVALEYPTDRCLTDWREVWLRDCFWHVLFAFILLVVMVIWRPSSNRSRFAYSLVTDADDDEVLFEQGNNKNFDTVKMRSVSRPGDPPPPPVTSQAEDDLKWVEENLPTTAMDKALPLLLDSDEEVMTTKFEMSKMN